MRRTQIHLLWNAGDRVRRFRTGVSLHGHTMHSHERLSAPMRYASRWPVTGGLVAMHERRYRRRHNCSLDFSRVYWTPPAPEREALEIERTQIQQGLGLHGLVSLTDHDSIAAALHLRVLEAERDLPVSVEWSVPFEGVTLHLGVHNLPAGHATVWMGAMADYTRAPSPETLADLLAAFDQNAGVLVVLNHPGWSAEGAGGAASLGAARKFLSGYGLWVHAVEVNGMRPWSENRAAMDLARAFHLPAVSGGDRHGCEPAAALNLTNTRDFAGFAAEVREDKISDILLLPHYRAPYRARCLETMWDVVRDHPEYSGRVRWRDRFFFLDDQGRHAPLSSVWSGAEPLALRCFLGAMNLFGNRRSRETLRQTLSGNEVSL